MVVEPFPSPDVLHLRPSSRHINVNEKAEESNDIIASCFDVGCWLDRAAKCFHLAKQQLSKGAGQAIQLIESLRVL